MFKLGTPRKLPKTLINQTIHKRGGNNCLKDKVNTFQVLSIFQICHLHPLKSFILFIISIFILKSPFHKYLNLFLRL